MMMRGVDVKVDSNLSVKAVYNFVVHTLRKGAVTKGVWPVDTVSIKVFVVNGHT